jgi:aryl-alcohol dehydrogenase-like predicted oxidoreductase
VEYRRHGDLRVSEVGVGCYSLTGVYGKKDVEEFVRMVRRAHDLGVNLFDTADVYGQAEEVLGEAVKPFREEILIATKVGPRSGVKPTLSREYVKEACRRSLEALQTDYIDLYQVHFDDPDTPVAETVGALEDLAAEGKIRRYGVGHLPLERVEAYCREGNVFSAMAELSAVSRRTREAWIPLCLRYGAKVIAFSTTGRGLLTGRFRNGATFEPGDIRNIDPLFQRESLQSGLRVADRLAEVGRRHGRTPVQAAIAWVLAQRGVLCALTGPSTVAHLEENVGASGWAFPADDREEFEAFLKREDAWLERRQRSSVRQILSEPLSADPAAAFADLIYVAETAVTLGLVEEAAVLPFLGAFLRLRKSLDEDKGQELRALQQQLRDIIPAD